MTHAEPSDDVRAAAGGEHRPSTHAELPVAVLLSPVVPRPGGSGRALRAWDWLRELAASHQVHVWTAAPVESPGGAADWPAHARLWSGGADLLPAAAGPRRLGWLVPALGTRWPRTVAHWQSPAAETPGLAAMAEAIGPRRVARLVVFRLYLHGVAERLRARLPVDRAELDLDDADAATLASVAGAERRMGRRLEAWLAGREAQQYRALERRVPARYDARWLAAAEDLPAHPGARCRPNRLPAMTLAPTAQPAAGEGPHLLFVGSLDYPPNQEAALFLATQLAPLLQRHRSAGWTLTVAGARPPAWLRARLQGRPPLRLLADVPDLAPLYAASTAVVLPVFAGGGTKFKTLEALAHGRPIVASAEAVRGLGLQAARHYLPAETAAQFVQALDRLHAEPALGHALADAGRIHLAGAGH